jgi:hypothetical protein
MLRASYILLSVIFAMPAAAQWVPPIRGHWTVTMTADPTYLGAVLIDAEGRVTWDGVWDPQYRIANGMPPGAGVARSRGYAITNASKVELIMTNSKIVERTHCILQSRDVMHCTPRAHGPAVILNRAGPGPQNLTTRSP